MKIVLNRVARPLTSLGFGRRVGIWVQGCDIRCEGCVSTDTWDCAGGTALDVDCLATRLADVVREEDLDGITITGGEPTLQADAVAHLVRGLRRSIASSVDLLLFTGRDGDDLAAYHQLLEAVDAYICGPFERHNRTSGGLISSANQRLVAVTALGCERYQHDDVSLESRLQGYVESNRIIFAGVSSPDNLALIEAKLLARGVLLEEKSW